MTIIDRAGSLAIAFSVVRARGMPWLIHGFLPTKSGDLAVLELAAHRRAEHQPLTQILAGLLLGDGARAVPGAERLERRGGVRARRGGCPARRRRSRRSSRRRGCRGPRRAGRRPRGSRCPSRSPRTCRRPAGAAGAAPARRDRSGSSRGAAPSRTCTPSTPGGPCRRGSARSAARRRRGGPRRRSCTRTGCRPSASTRRPVPSLRSVASVDVICSSRLPGLRKTTGP